MTLSQIISIFPFIIFLACTCVAFIAFFKALRYKRTFTDTPLAKITSAAQGYAKIKGIVQSFDEKQLLTSPLTQRSCCWYTYSVVKLPISKNDRPEIIEEKTSTNLFRLLDDTGECVIYPLNAEVVATAGTWQTRGLDLKLIKANPILLKRLQSKLQNNGLYEFTESRLTMGKEATVIGYLENYSCARNPFDVTDIAHSEWNTLKNNQERVNLISNFNLEGRPYLITDQDYNFKRDSYKNLWIYGLLFFASGIALTAWFFYIVNGGQI